MLSLYIWCDTCINCNTYIYTCTRYCIHIHHIGAILASDSFPSRLLLVWLCDRIPACPWSNHCPYGDPRTLEEVTYIDLLLLCIVVSTRSVQHQIWFYYYCIRLHPRYLEADRTFVVMELLVSYSQKASGAWDAVSVNWGQFDPWILQHLDVFATVGFVFLSGARCASCRQQKRITTNLEDFFPSFSIYPGAVLSLRVLVTWISRNLFTWRHLVLACCHRTLDAFQKQHFCLTWPMVPGSSSWSVQEPSRRECE